MTNVYDRLRIRTESRLAGLLVVVASGLLGLLAIGKRTLDTFSGGGADMAHHYGLVYWFSHHWTLPLAHDASLAEMGRYPPAAHVLAAFVGRVVGSPFRGMQLVALAGIVLIWCAIAALLMQLPGRRRWVALSALVAILALTTAAGPLRLHVHGFEIVSNFFFAEAVGQGLLWWLVWFAVRRRLAGRSSVSTALPVAIAAVLATFVHLVPAVELLFLVVCLCGAELLERWRTGLRTARSLAVPVVLPAATALAIVLSPGFRAMRALSANNGSLDVPYLSGLAGYICVAVAVVIVSVVVLLMSANGRNDAATAAVLQGLGFVGIAVAVPCVVQALALAASQGSPYAVKKYIFGLLTVLVVDACVMLATLVSHAPPDNPPRPAVRFAAIVALSVVAVLAVFSHAGSGYSMSAITTLEHRVITVATAARLRRDHHNYAVALPHSDPVLDYMFSLAVLRAPKNPLHALLLGKQPQLASSNVLTAVSSDHDLSTCRSFGPRDALVVVEATCVLKATSACEGVNILGEGGVVADSRLHGFSWAEPTGRWTDGRRASFSCVFPNSAPQELVTIDVDATAFLPPRVPRQRVMLAVGHEQKSFVFTPQAPHAVLRLVVPFPVSRRLTLTLTLPDAVSPRDAGVSVDARKIALFVSQIRIG